MIQLYCNFCGHRKEQHKDFYVYILKTNDDFCTGCESYRQQVHKFKLDNLSYLEMKAEEHE
jgi:hypothetical protein